MYERLLVAIDDSAATERVLKAASDLASLANGEVWVLHLREAEILPKAMVPATESRGEAREFVDAAVAGLAKAGVKAHGEVRSTFYGQAAKEIIDDARSHDVGVIVMGSKGHGDLAGLLLGSTAHKVIHLADRPVLVVR